MLPAKIRATFPGALAVLHILLLASVHQARGERERPRITPNARDEHTLHLWHLDEAQPPFKDDSGSPLPLSGLLNGALAGQASLPGLGSSVSFRGNAGGIPGESSLKGAVLLARPSLDCGPADNAPPDFTYFGEDGAFTFEAFIRPELLPEDAQVTALTILSMDGEAGERIFSFRIEPQGFLTFNPLPDCGAKGGAMASIPRSGPHAINTRDWFHVAVTYDGNANTRDNLTLYWTRIGADVTEANVIGKGTLSDDLNGLTGDLAIGNEARTKPEDRENAEAEPFPGRIDEVRISSVARHPTDFAFLPAGKRVAPGQWGGPVAETRESPPFSLRLARVMINGKSVPVPRGGAPIKLGSGLYRLAFDFGPASGSPGTAFRIRSQLAGIDEQWNESTTGMSLICQVLDGVGTVVSEAGFGVEGTSAGWADRPEDSFLEPRSEPIYIPLSGRKIRVILASGTPETTGSVVIDDLQFSAPGQGIEPLWENSDFRRGTNLTSPAGVPDGWRRMGDNTAIPKAVMFMDNPTRDRTDVAIALVDAERTKQGSWESVRELDPELHAGKTLILSWKEAYNVIPGNLQRASYSNVPPGNYTFRAIGFDDSTLTTVAITLPIHISPPFWQRLWFWPVVTACIVILLALAIYSRARRLSRRKLRELAFQHAMEQDRTRIARDMHDDLGTRITVLTATASIARREIGSDPEKARSHLDRLTHSARELVVAMDGLVWAVDPAHDTLDQFATHLTRLGEEIYRDSEVRLRLDIPDELPPRQLVSDLRHNLALATKESMHNVLKHAGPCEVHISLRYAGDSIAIEIRDTGCGFQPDGGSSGHGRGNLASRLAEIGGTFEISSAPGRGTCVRLSCPLPPK